MKERMITRTIINTIATVKGANLIDNTIETKTFALVGSFKSNDEVMQAVKAFGFDNSFMPVMVEEAKEEEKLYGMSESLFMTYAKELPPRKVYES